MNTIALGSAPSFESCVQTTDPEYETKAHSECRRYIRGLETYYRSHRKMPVPFDLKVVVRAHDFGRYMEVAAVCETEYQVTEAEWLQGNLPEMWSDCA
jgi:hypothetical protein